MYDDTPRFFFFFFFFFFFSHLVRSTSVLQRPRQMTQQLLDFNTDPFPADPIIHGLPFRKRTVRIPDLAHNRLWLGDFRYG